jgi:hypothetical protein
MLSFAELWEQMDSAQKSPLMDSGEETKATELIRAGEQLRKEDQPSFWDDFLSLLSNSEGFGELLKIGSDKVLSWPERIREARNKLEKSDSGKRNPEEETEVTPTGDNGAVTASNQDPMR